MRVFLVIALLFLVSCSTVVSDGSAELTTFEPVWECHVEAEIQGDNVLFTASGECNEHRIIPFEIVDERGDTIYDGGVYAHSTSVWPIQKWPGVYRVVHGQHRATIATIEVERSQ